MKTSDYVEYDGLGLAALLRTGEVTAAEVLEAALAVIAERNPQLNAVTALYREEAEAALRRGLPAGPFTGVPFLVKDLGVSWAGKPSTMGSRMFERFVPPADSELMARYRRAGLLALGKTSVPELGLSYATEPALFGPCRNPWDATRSPGGSSGGAGAAVAARMVPLANASDAAGSLRAPASACGLFGLKPTRGRTPTGPFAGELVFGLGIEHALTRSVRDSAALLDATMGEDVGPPYGAPTPSRSFLAEVTTDPGRLRIAFTTEAWSGAPVASECQAAVDHAAQLCAELGHTLLPASPPIDWPLLRLALDRLLCAYTAQLIDGLGARFGLRADPTTLEPATLVTLEHGRRMSAADLVAALAIRDALARGVGEFFTTCDVLLTPTLAQPPLPLGALALPSADASATELLDRQFAFSPFTALFNLTGTPAMSVPLDLSPAGLPIGVQFAAPFAADAVLFRLAGQLERAAPWAGRRPPAS